MDPYAGQPSMDPYAAPYGADPYNDQYIAPGGGGRTMVSDGRAGYAPMGQEGGRGPPMGGPSMGMGGGGEGMDAGGLDTMGYGDFDEEGGGAHEHIQKIDPETGIAPRRLTDCVCTIIFFFWMLGMILLVCTSNGDPTRLTHGVDYAARLCGVDPGVETRPYIFYCRKIASATDETGVPTDLNLDNPVCVSKCPSSLDMKEGVQVPCLMNAYNNPTNAIDGGQFGNVKTWFLSSQQTTLNTTVYDSYSFAGRYCMPSDRDLRHIVMNPIYGPLTPGLRLQQMMGSFQDPWAIMFLITVVAILVSIVYVYLLKVCAKVLVSGFLCGTALLCLVMGGYFFFAVVSYFDGVVPAGTFEKYEESNPLFQRYPRVAAASASVTLGTLLILSFIGLLAMIDHVLNIFFSINELVDCAFSAIQAMPSMLIPPVIEALWKFFLLWALCYNFMFLVSTGYKDDYRININGVRYEGPSAKMYFDYWELIGIAFYIIGGIWVMELTQAFGQFIVSFSVVSWYYMPKEGKRKVSAPRLAPMHAVSHGIFYHLGSLLLGAAVIPYGRVFRTLQFVFFDNLPHPDEVNPCCKCCCGCIVNIANCFKSILIRCQIKSMCGEENGWVWYYTKDAYTDIIIRSNHFFQASKKVRAVLSFHVPCQKYIGKLSIITFVGVISIANICGALAFLLIMTIPALNDPTSSNYVYDPMMVSFLAMILGGMIGYGFLMLIDHSADCLLYCYAWNKRFKRNLVDKYVPEDLRQIVGFEDKNPDEYAYYGRADPNMYLGTFLQTGSAGQTKPLPKNEMLWSQRN